MFVNKLIIHYGNFFLKNIPRGLKILQFKNNNLCLNINSRDLFSICQFLKKQTNLQYKTLLDIVAIDYPLDVNRFVLVYNFLSLLYNERIFVKCRIKNLSSLTSIRLLFLAAG